jgi:hypothetical protein
VLVLLGRPNAAGAAYRAAREQWQRLTGALRDVDWDDVQLTRRAETELTEGRVPAAPARTMPEEEWRRLAPPWHPWEQQTNSAEFQHT